MLFQAGEHDWTAARAPDKDGPAPPFQPPADLADSVAACVRSGLLTVVGTGRGEYVAVGDGRRYLVDRWIASSLQVRLADSGRAAELAAAHQRAAEYWQWRAAAWPQGRRSDVHDLLEARQHLFSAGATDAASQLTEVICAQLHAWGDLDREAELILSTLDLLPTESAGRAGWLHELGATAQVRRDFAEAARRYHEAAALFGSLGEERGVARCQHSLGVLAQAQGEYRQAERHYRLAAAADQRAAAADQRAAVSDRLPPPADRRATASSRRAEVSDRRAEVSGRLPPPADRRATASGRRAAAPVADQDKAAARFESAAGETRSAAAPVTDPAPAPVPAQPRPPLGQHAPEAADADAVGLPKLHRPWLLIGSAAAMLGAAVGVLGFMAVVQHPADRGRQPPTRQPAARQPAARLPSVQPPAVVRRQAAAWAASQLSRSAIVACDPVMCAALRRAGLPAGDTLRLGPGGPADPLGSDVVVATAAVRAEFGNRLAKVYAPLVLAAFGSAGARIEIRVSAPDGAAAYLRQVSEDRAARRSLGTELADNSRVSIGAGCRAQLTGGRVDLRLLSLLATAADLYRLHIVALGDAGPGASPQIPLRSAEVTVGGGYPSSGWLRSVISFMNAQRQPFRPARIELLRASRGREFLLIEFAAPSPLGPLSSANVRARHTTHR